MAWYRFWLNSNRGTKEYAYIESSEDDVKNSLEGWCSQFYAWQNSHCDYGYEKMTVLPPCVTLGLLTDAKRQIKRLEEQRDHLFKELQKGDKMPIKKQLLFWLKDHRFSQQDESGNIWHRRGSHFKFAIELKARKFLVSMKDRDGEEIVSQLSYSPDNFANLLKMFKKDGIS